MQQKRILSSQTQNQVGKMVKLSGWVHARRDHGKIIFIDLRDRSGLVQIVFAPDLKPKTKNQKSKIYELAQTLRPEWVISIQGKVNKRPKGQENPKISSGTIEVTGETLEILNQSKTPPIEVAGKIESGEEIRLKYRYLDLRREKPKNNLTLRHKTMLFIREFLDKNGFLEVETPILTKSTPEGARDFLVPSRLHPGKFYALPQAPQQLKQLLMVAGLEKYFQIARCFRDEDLRGDRQPEFTQLDMEMSFVSQNEILNLVEELLIKMVDELNREAPRNHAELNAEPRGKLKISKTPFPHLSYKKAMKEYKTDKPDLRKDKNNPNELAFCWITDWPLFEWNQEEKRLDPMHHIFTAPQKKDIPLLDKEPLRAHSWQHDLVLNGHEIAGGSIRIHKRQIQEKVFKLIGLKKEEIQEKFGHLLRAFEYGAPPHGGIAMGLDRLLMIMLGETSIREVIAFPKDGTARDLVMEAPTEVEPRQLKELGIQIKK